LHVRRSLILLSLLLGCGRASLNPGFVLRIGVPGTLPQPTPFMSTTAAGPAIELVFASLLVPDEDGTFHSAVLKRWERVGPGKFRIEPRTDLLFSDGSPATLDDFSTSIRAQGLTVTPDKSWLDVRSEQPSALIEAALTTTILFKKIGERYLGTGAFVVAQADLHHILLTRRSPVGGRIGAVELIAFADPRERFGRLLRGEANAALGLDDRQMELLDGVPGLKTIRHIGPNTFTLFLNPRRLDRNARQALLGALPLEEIGRVAEGERCREQVPRHVVSSAPAGRPVEIMVPQVTAGWERAAIAIRRALGPRGGEVRRLDPVRASQALSSSEFDLSLAFDAARPFSLVRNNWLSGSPNNWLHYSNALLDEALLRGDEKAARAELARDAVIFFLCQSERLLVLDARVKNPSLGYWNMFETLPDWEVAP
jgi:hypothetical protein